MAELNKLAYCVQQSGYTVEFGNNIITQKLEGGPSRYRVDSKNNVHLVNSSWAVNDGGYQYSKNGRIYTVSAMLEVAAKPRDDAFDDAVVMLGNSQAFNVLNPLEKLVNEDFSNALGGK